jgi:hypothetical protein
MSKFDFLSIYIKNLPDDERNSYLLRAGKSETEIGQLEAEAGIVVPNELREFYKFSYGAELNEYKILTISEIAEFLPELHWTYEDSWRESIFPFAYLVGVGDFIAFDVEQQNAAGLLILDCFHELSPEEWNGICFGLKNWMMKLAENNFVPFWLEAD